MKSMLKKCKNTLLFFFTMIKCLGRKRGESSVKNRRNINRFDPFVPVNMTGLGKRKLNDNFNMNIENEVIQDKSINFFTIDDKFRASIPSIKKGFAVLLTKKEIGNKNEIGEKLLEDFIFSLSELIELPQYVILLNEAIYLMDNKNICDLIFKMQKYGVKFLVSIESMEFFNYSVSLKGVKQSTSADITEKIIFSEKLINI